MSAQFENLTGKMLPEQINKLLLGAYIECLGFFFSSILKYLTIGFNILTFEKIWAQSSYNWGCTPQLTKLVNKNTQQPKGKTFWIKK